MRFTFGLVLFVATFTLCSAASLPDQLLAILFPSGAPGYSYNPSASDGPPNWGSIDPVYATCDNGISQSPINLPCPPGNPQILANEPSVSTASALFELGQGSLNFELGCPTPGLCGSTNYNGATYNLINVHFHSPSEHKENGQSYPLEAHLVHQSSSGALLVVGVLFSEGGGDNCITTAPTETGSNSEVASILSQIENGLLPTVAANTASFVEVGTSFVSYAGSLTTPPCSEGVTWFVSDRRQTISASDVNRYRNLVNGNLYGNARPVQPRNGRPTLYGRGVL